MNSVTMRLDLDEYAVIVLPKEMMQSWWDLDASYLHFQARALVVAELRAQGILSQVSSEFAKDGVKYTYDAKVNPEAGFEFTTTREELK